MASAKDLRKRITSVKNTQQITKAMKMVSAAKLRRAQENILAIRPYAHELNKVIQSLSKASGGENTHPLLAAKDPSDVNNALVVIVNVTWIFCSEKRMSVFASTGL